MSIKTPSHWYQKAGFKAFALWPLSALYCRLVKLGLWFGKNREIGAPVLCIGNFVAGGGGKTPSALGFGKAALARGLKPGFLSRGYGGAIKTPCLVNTRRHSAADVGDEALLLAKTAPTVISANRRHGAEKLLEMGCNFIIMDDGFQNSQIYKDFSLIAVDGKRGVGNGFAIPAGPLRLGLRDQLLRADAIALIGDTTNCEKLIRIAARAGKPVHLVGVKTIDPKQWRKKRVIAFAGIANPDKFFDSLKQCDADLVETICFGDHHWFDEAQINVLLERAKKQKAELVTTEKDFVRLKGIEKAGIRSKNEDAIKTSKAAKRLADKTGTLDIELVFDDPRIAGWIIDDVLSRYAERA